MTTASDLVDDPWESLRRSTQARIGLARSGNALSTTELLAFAADHAAARDAVHTPMDSDSVLAGLRGLGLGEPVVVASRAASRSEYLRRPDLGRLPGDLGAIESSGADIGFVIADGLSATAVDTHAVALVAAIVGGLEKHLTLAPPVIATQARVALGDHIGEAMGVETVIVIIGERPGLSVADSLGVYLTYGPRPGRRDSERNCVSNVHPPDGLSYEATARTVAALVTGARRLGATGVGLKAISPTDPLQSLTSP